MNELIKNSETINRLLARYGVKFGIYKNGEFKEQLFPFDPIPRIIKNSEFKFLEKGLKQRVNALNCFLSDIYGEKRIVRDGVIPEEFIYSAKGFLPPCDGVTPPKNIYSHISGIDLVQSKDNKWYILEDNLRVPSGASYPMIARELQRRSAPDAFSETGVVDNRNYADMLKAEQRLSEMGRYRAVRFISCQGLVKNKKLMDSMRRMLARIQSEYDYPVDTEFTINFSDDGEYTIDLLQCRPLQVVKGKNSVDIPADVTEEHILLSSRGASMGLSREEQLDYIVYVDPIGYYNMPYKDKNTVAQMIGRINWHFRNAGKHMMLMVPGRIGTSSQELGVPTMFSDISGFDVICEMEESKAGYNPELSYGSHIFQDLVEAEILYTAVFNNSKTLAFYPEKLNRFENVAAEFDDSGALSEIVKIFKVEKCTLYHDINKEQLLITL